MDTAKYDTKSFDPLYLLCPVSASPKASIEGFSILGVIMAKRKQLNRKLRMSLIKVSNFTCEYCGKYYPPNSIVNKKISDMVRALYLNIDHYYPKSKGGLDEIKNFVVACRDCNYKKSNKIPFGQFILEGN